MRAFGIVCECNPFHAGHRFIMEKARQNGAEAIVAVMSGDFVQRGEPALVSKFARAADLVENGCDLVLELPVRYSLASAEGFAEGAVKLLAASGAADVLFFGSECGDVGLLKEAAELQFSPGVLEETASLAESGLSWPAAREKVLASRGREDISGLLKQPNNILAVEYIKALSKTGASLEALTCARGECPSNAHVIRELYAAGKKVTGLVTGGTLAELEAGATPDPEAWSRIAMYRLRSLSREELGGIEDAAGGLGDRIFSAARSASSLEELYAAAKTKRYTMSRVKRVCCRAVLGTGSSRTSPERLRLLAVGEKGKELLARMGERAALPIRSGLKPDEQGPQALEERRATDLWNLILKNPGPSGEDMTRKLYVRK